MKADNFSFFVHHFVHSFTVSFLLFCKAKLDLVWTRTRIMSCFMKRMDRKFAMTNVF